MSEVGFKPAPTTQRLRLLGHPDNEHLAHMSEFPMLARGQIIFDGMVNYIIKVYRIGSS